MAKSNKKTPEPKTTKPKKEKSKSTLDSRTRKLSKKEKRKVIKSYKTVPSAYKILQNSLKHLWKNKKLFIGITLVYGLLYFVLVKGLATNFQLQDTRSLLEETFGNEVGGVETAVTLFGTLIGSAGTVASDSAGVYQAILFVLASLATIWALRQTFDNKKIKVKQAFYKSTQQLIPYVLIYLLIAIQLIPMLIGVSIYGVVTSNGIAISAIEQIAWFLFLIMSVSLSFYFIVNSLIASYIVTLAGVEPVEALRLAKKLVRYRRLMIIRKILFFAFAVCLFVAVIFIPLVFIVPTIAEIAFLLLTFMLLIVVHAYMYSLYKELI